MRVQAVKLLLRSGPSLSWKVFQGTSKNCLNMTMAILLKTDWQTTRQLDIWKWQCTVHFRADSRLAPNQWEMSLQSNAISHWLSTNLESALKWTVYYIMDVRLSGSSNEQGCNQHGLRGFPWKEICRKDNHQGRKVEKSSCLVQLFILEPHVSKIFMLMFEG